MLLFALRRVPPHPAVRWLPACYNDDVKTLSVIAVVAALALLWPRPADPMPAFPHVFLWAWERPENLEFLDPHAAGVAFLRAPCVCAMAVCLSARASIRSGTRPAPC